MHKSPLFRSSPKGFPNFRRTKASGPGACWAGKLFFRWFLWPGPILLWFPPLVSIHYTYYGPTSWLVIAIHAFGWLVLQLVFRPGGLAVLSKKHLYKDTKNDLTCPQASIFPLEKLPKNGLEPPPRRLDTRIFFEPQKRGETTNDSCCKLREFLNLNEGHLGKDFPEAKVPIWSDQTAEIGRFNLLRTVNVSSVTIKVRWQLK